MRRNMIKLTENRLRKMVHRAVKRTLNEASDFDNLTPDMESFLSSLYDLIVAYHDVLGKEAIANELEGASEFIRNGGGEDDYEWGIIPDE
jgi:hypothetical protein